MRTVPAVVKFMVLILLLSGLQISWFSWLLVAPGIYVYATHTSVPPTGAVGVAVGTVVGAAVGAAVAVGTTGVHGPHSPHAGLDAIPSEIQVLVPATFAIPEVQPDV